MSNKIFWVFTNLKKCDLTLIEINVICEVPIQINLITAGAN
jgi:hypothetical protein